jgi:hypothetical protein
MKQGQVQKRCRNLALVLLFVVLAVAEQLNAAMVIEGGTASSGFDAGCSPVLGTPPNSLTRVSYGEADLMSSPGGSMGDIFNNTSVRIQAAKSIMVP